jgi:tetratricopeptide (TPR) repeat protein
MALNAVSKVLEFEKNHLDSILLMARIYNSMGDFSKSDEIYWKAFNINPEQHEVKHFTSIKLKKMKECLVRVNNNLLNEKFEMGLLWTSKALSHYPNHPKALLLRSAIYRRLNRLDESLVDLNLAAQHMNIGNSKDKVIKSICKTYNELAVSLIKDGTDEAYRMLNEALKLDEQSAHSANSAQTLFNLGLCLMERKEIYKALETFQKCLKLNPNYPRAKLQCSIIYYKMAIMSFNSKEYIEAINYIQIALSDKFDCADFFLLRAKCFLKLSQLNKAFDDIQTCLKIDPKKQEAIEIKKSLNY